MKRSNFFSGFCTCLVMLFLYGPLVLVLVNAFNKNISLVSWGGFTLQWFKAALEDSAVRADFVTTVEMAAWTTLISLIVATTAALWSRTASSVARTFLATTTYMRIALPEVVITVALFIIFLRIGMPFGMPAIILGQTVLVSAYAFVIIQARLENMGFVLEEAASDLGADAFRIFRKVTLPVLSPALMAAGLLSFTISADDVLVPIFLGGGNAETLPVLIIGLTRFHLSPIVNVIGILFMLVTVVSLVLATSLAGLGVAGGVSLGASRDGEAKVSAGELG